MVGLRKQSKRILYTIRKDGTCYLSDLSFGGGKQGKKRALEVLRRLSDKGLVTSRKSPLRGENNKYSVRAYYWLTEEGIKIADEIAKEVDEYKKW